MSTYRVSISGLWQAPVAAETIDQAIALVVARVEATVPTFRCPRWVGIFVQASDGTYREAQAAMQPLPRKRR